jgi:hypothetical protein
MFQDIRQRETEAKHKNVENNAYLMHHHLPKASHVYFPSVPDTNMYEGNSISKLQIQVANYVFELSAGNIHR